jgi:hypothetical protein
MLSAAVLCVACSGSSAPGTPTPALTPAGLTPQPASLTGIDAIDRTILLLLAGDAATLTKAAVFQRVPCQANPPSLSTGLEPQCTAGVDTGTPIDAFLISECEGVYVISVANLQSAIQTRLGMGSPHSVYAVVKGGVIDSQTGLADPDVAYTIMLADGSPPATGSLASLWLITASGELAGYFPGCGQTDKNYEDLGYFGPNPTFIYGPIAAAPAPVATQTP